MPCPVTHYGQTVGGIYHHLAERTSAPTPFANFASTVLLLED
jgi:hypothetical protein